MPAYPSPETCNLASRYSKEIYFRRKKRRKKGETFVNLPMKFEEISQVIEICRGNFEVIAINFYKNLKHLPGAGVWLEILN